MKIAFYGSSLLSSYWNGAATYYRGMIRALSELGYADHVFRIRRIRPPAASRHRPAGLVRRGRLRGKPAGDGRRRRGSARRGYRRQGKRLRLRGRGAFRPADRQPASRLAVAFLGCRRASDARRAFSRTGSSLAPATLPNGSRADLWRRRSRGEGLPLPWRAGTACRSTTRSIHAIIIACRPRPRSLPIFPSWGTACRTARRASRASSSTWRSGCRGNVSCLAAPAGTTSNCRPTCAPSGTYRTADHNAFNCSPLAVLNVSRESMASTGFSPATRVFEAAGAGACLITDDWAGLDLFLKDGEEVLKARDGKEVGERLLALDRPNARAIGERARRRVLAEHTYQARAAQFDAVIKNRLAQRMTEAAE